MITLIRKNVDPIITKPTVKVPAAVIQAAGGAPSTIKAPETVKAPTKEPAKAATKEPAKAPVKAPTTAKEPAKAPTTAKEHAKLLAAPTCDPQVVVKPPSAGGAAQQVHPPKAITKEEAIDDADHEILKNLRAKYGKEVLIRVLQEMGI